MSEVRFRTAGFSSLLKIRGMMRTLRVEDMRAVERSIYEAQGSWGWRFPHAVGGQVSILLALRARLKQLEKRSDFQDFRAEIMDSYQGAGSSSNIVFIVAFCGTHGVPTHIWRTGRGSFVMYPVGTKGA